MCSIRVVSTVNVNEDVLNDNSVAKKLRNERKKLKNSLATLKSKNTRNTIIELFVGVAFLLTLLFNLPKLFSYQDLISRDSIFSFFILLAIMIVVLLGFFTAAYLARQIIGKNTIENIKETNVRLELIDDELSELLKQECIDYLYEWYGAEFVNADKLFENRSFVQIKLNDGSTVGISRIIFNKIDGMTVHLVDVKNNDNGTTISFMSNTLEHVDSAPLKRKSASNKNNEPVDVIANLKNLC